MCYRNLKGLTKVNRNVRALGNAEYKQYVFCTFVYKGKA